VSTVERMRGEGVVVDCQEGWEGKRRERNGGLGRGYGIDGDEGRDGVAELAVGRSRYLGMAGEKLARRFGVA